MTNGSAGDVKSMNGGVGSMTVARAYNKSVPGPDDILNLCNVINSDTEGKGMLRPGGGSPGNGGTAKAFLIRLCIVS